MQHFKFDIGLGLDLYLMFEQLVQSVLQLLLLILLLHNDGLAARTPLLAVLAALVRLWPLRRDIAYILL